MTLKILISSTTQKPAEFLWKKFRQ